MALSDDLRERVVGAVVEGGMSRNGAAKRFGVSIASAVRWGPAFTPRARFRRLRWGRPAFRSYRGSSRLSLLGLIRRQPDMTLLEIQERLIVNCGERFSSSVLWRFFDRHDGMARPVCKGFCRDCRLISLLQRIRPRGAASGHDGAPVLIKLPASDRAVF